jgi:hypothetical protein
MVAAALRAAGFTDVRKEAAPGFGRGLWVAREQRSSSWSLPAGTVHTHRPVANSDCTWSACPPATTPSAWTRRPVLALGPLLREHPSGRAPPAQFAGAGVIGELGQGVYTAAADRGGFVAEHGDGGGEAFGVQAGGVTQGAVLVHVLAAEGHNQSNGLGRLHRKCLLTLAARLSSAREEMSYMLRFRSCATGHLPGRHWALSFGCARQDRVGSWEPIAAAPYGLPLPEGNYD